MPQRSLENRVTILERRMDALEQLPARVASLEGQIVQLRDEMRVEFSALRVSDDQLRQGIAIVDAALREEIRSAVATLRNEIQAGDEETRRYMRVLHKDVISRFALLGEHRHNRG